MSRFQIPNVDRFSDHLFRFIAVFALILSLYMVLGSSEALSKAPLHDFIITVVTLVIGAASLFFIVFSFSIYQETKNVEAVSNRLEQQFADYDQRIAHQFSQFQRMSDNVLAEYSEFRSLDRKRWKEAIVYVAYMLTKIIEDINENEEQDDIREQLQLIFPLRYLLQSVTVEDGKRTLSALRDCVGSIEAVEQRTGKTFPERMCEVLLETVDSQRSVIQNDRRLQYELDEVRSRALAIAKRAEIAQAP